MSKTKVWACPDCKSKRVQAEMWVLCNTNEVLDDTESYYWCNNCEEARQRLDEIEECDTLEGAPVDINRREMAAILSALRYWQQNPWPARDQLMDDSSGDWFALSDTEINALCEKLNFGD